MGLFRNGNFIILNCLLFTFLIITPSVVKIAHAIFEHDHNECTAIGELHMHEVELDCDFHDFNISPQFHSIVNEILIPRVSVMSTKIISFYTYLSKFQKLHFALRGPPTAS